MIAVSSNNREVQVFRFGCRDLRARPDSDEDWVDLSDEARVESFSGYAHSSLFPRIGVADSEIPWNNFRKVLKLTPEGHNIPCIDFSSDSEGDARSVLATDILGNLWILDIWRDGDPDDWLRRIPSMHKQSLRGNGPM